MDHCLAMAKWLAQCNEAVSNARQAVVKSSNSTWSTDPREQHKKAKDTAVRDESARLEGVQYATGEEQRAITTSSKNTEVAGQSRNSAQLRMRLVVKVERDAVKNSIAWEPGVSGPRIKVN